MSQPFTHLNTHSHYSILEAIGSIDALITKTKELGFTSIALTDTHNLFGAIEFYEKATKAEIKPIIGISILCNSFDHNSPEILYPLTLIAQSYAGYLNIIELASIVRLNPHKSVSFEQLSQYSEDIICLTGNYQGEIAQYLLNNSSRAQDWQKAYTQIFPNRLYIELVPIDNTQQIKANTLLTEFSTISHIPPVITAQTKYLNPSQSTAHDIMLAIKHKTTILNSERMSFISEDYSLKSADQMWELIHTYHLPEEAYTNTQVIADQCNTIIPLYQIQLPAFIVPPLKTGEILPNEDYLRHLCNLGIQKRYPNRDLKPIQERLDYEFEVIKKSGYIDYFLIVSDFITWAKNNQILVGPGRGSAAGSLVAYLLAITDLDPLEYQLLFERFLNPARVSMPDIDIDFQDNKRELVLDYVAHKYGQDHVAQICTFGTMAAKAAVRDVGRALGYSYSFCDSIAKLINKKTIAKSLDDSRELRTRYEQEEKVAILINTAQELEGSIRHTSTHACAVVISPQKLTAYTPLQISESGGKQAITTQYEMHAIEDLGLLKMDFLGLSNLSTIEKALDLITLHTGTIVDITQLPMEDKLTYALFQKGQTTGVFQFESQGMKKALMGLKPTNFNDLIAMVSLYRPGPMELIPTYIARKHGKEEVTYLHPNLEVILKPTYGIMIYQEQLMQASQAIAGFSLPEADTLRKAVGKKIKELMEEQKIKIIEGTVAQGIDRSIGEKLWELIEPFGDYGFNKSHAACYALISYQTAYLKAHYPMEFMVSLLNSDEKDMPRIAIDIQEARQLGLTVQAPNINQSQAEFSGKDSSIYYGLASIRNMSSNLAHSIATEREQNGPYSSLENFFQRIPSNELNKKNIEALINSGSLDIFYPRHILIHNTETIITFIKNQTLNAPKENQFSLFGNDIPQNSLELQTIEQDAETQLKTILELENHYLGLWVSAHPINTYQSIQEEYTLPSIQEIKSAKRKTGMIASGIIKEIKHINTKNGAKMAFIVIEDKTDSIESIIFPNTYKAISDTLISGSGIAFKGKRQDTNGTSQFIVSEAMPLQDSSLGSWIQSKTSPISSNSVEEIGSPQEYQENEDQRIPKTEDGIEIVGVNLIIPAHTTKDILQKIKDILTREPRGNCPIYLVSHYNTPKEKVIKTSFSIQYSSELIARLQYILNNQEE